MWINSKSGSIVAGNLTKNPEFKYVGNKRTPLLKISIGIGKDEQGKAIYADIAAWNRLAELINRYDLCKGDPIAVFGVWAKNTANNGKVYWTLNADFISVLSSKPDTTHKENELPNDMDFGDMPDFMK